MSPIVAPHSVQKALYKNLHEPAAYILGKPGKGFRSRLVQIGCRLALGSAPLTEEHQRRCEIAATVVERIHAGSLVVDDIQDESVIRRDAPTLHLKYGMARALNTGNWLYFSPLLLLKDLGLSQENELYLHRDCLEILSTAHCGQALDVGTRIDEIPQECVPQICASSVEWKTGAFVGLSLQIGAYAADASKSSRDLLHFLGRELGTCLQMFDDLGNFFMDSKNPMASKRREDLKLRRPSWIWSFVATHFTPECYADWLRAVHALPNEEPLHQFTQTHSLLVRARFEASLQLRNVADRLERSFPLSASAHEEISSLISKLEKAYG